MSLNRTALRLATILALTNNQTAPYPTIGEGRVYDARLDPILGVDSKELIPIAVVYTDDDNGSPLSENNGGPPFRRTVNLIIEISMGMIGEDDDGVTFDLPLTEPELDAQLDLFEFQIRFALANTLNPWTALWWGTAVRILGWSSQRFVTSEGNARLAARQITAQVEIKDDCLPEIAVMGPLQSTLPANIQALLDAVVAAGSPSYVQPLVETLTLAGTPSGVLVEPLKTIAMTELAPTANDAGVQFSAKDLDQ